MKMLNKIAGMVIFSLIVMVLTTMNSKAVPMPTNTDDATATVYVHIPLKIDPIVPKNDGHLVPDVFYRSLNGNVIYTVQDATSHGTRIPYAEFGVNGDQNAPVSITYSTYFGTGTSSGFGCVGGWYWQKINGSNVTSGDLAIDVDLSNLSGSLGTTLSGEIPSVSLNPSEYTGGVSLFAYVKSITVTPNSPVNGPGTHNSLVFTITAAYNF